MKPSWGARRSSPSQWQQRCHGWLDLGLHCSDWGREDRLYDMCRDLSVKRGAQPNHELSDRLLASEVLRPEDSRRNPSLCRWHPPLMQSQPHSRSKLSAFAPLLWDTEENWRMGHGRNECRVVVWKRRMAKPSARLLHPFRGNWTWTWSVESPEHCCLFLRRYSSPQSRDFQFDQRVSFVAPRRMLLIAQRSGLSPSTFFKRIHS